MDQIRQASSRGIEGLNNPQFFQQVLELKRQGAFKNREVKGEIQMLGWQLPVSTGWIDATTSFYREKNFYRLREYLEAGKALGYDLNPKINKWIRYLETKTKPPSRKKAGTRLASAAVATAILTTLVASQEPVSSFLQNIPAKPPATEPAKPSPMQMITPITETTPTPAPPTPTSSPTPEAKTFKKDIFREQIAPKIYAQALQKRHERYANDADFRERVNFARAQDRIFVLLAGATVRLRDPETGAVEEDPLTDSMQLLSYHIPSNTLHIISIPRDLQSPEVLKRTKSPVDSRINQAWAGGAELLIEAVENATDLPVDFYVHENSDFLKDLVNLLGGVEVILDKEIRDNTYPTDNFGFKRIYYPKGPNVLNGEQAVEVIRSRHDSTDLNRSQRQQKIMTALANKMLNAGWLDQLRLLKSIDDLWYKKVADGTIKPDFDLNSLFMRDFLNIAGTTPRILWDKLVGGLKVAEMPTIFSTDLTGTNLAVGAGIIGSSGGGAGWSMLKVKEGNAYSVNPRRDYWLKTRTFSGQFIEGKVGEPPDTEEVKLEIPAREQRILHPEELSYDEVKKWIGNLRNSHESVITESLFTKELASLPADARQKVMEAIAKAHASALVGHFGDNEAIIGLDPGHGGSDIGSSGVTPEGKILREQDLTWQLSQMIAEQIYYQSAGKYYVVFLRPQEPADFDLDEDGYVSPIERLQKRKALLLETEKRLRLNPAEYGKNIVYLSVHLNGSPNPDERGTEVFYPNETATSSEHYRQKSKELADSLQKEIIRAIREAGYNVADRGAKEDPDKRQPQGNSEITTGPYIVVGSPKLDRDLKPTR